MGTASKEQANSANTSQFVTALIIGCITVGGMFLFWLIFHGRRNLTRVFQGRTLLAPADKRPQMLPTGIFSWWKQIFQVRDEEIIRINGPDAYFVVRYLKVFGVTLLVPYTILSIAICVPMATMKPNANQDGVNKLIYGNVPDNKQLRHLGHLVVAVILIAITLFFLWREFGHLMDVRTRWLKTEAHSRRSRTVALVNVPKDMFTEGGIRELASHVASQSTQGPRPSGATHETGVVNTPTGVTQVWLGRKVKPIIKVWEKRDKECTRLEGGVGKLLKAAAKNVRKDKTPEAKGTWKQSETGSPLDRYVLPKKQPKWRQGFLGLIGKKMNLETSPVYIREQNTELDQLRSNMGDYKPGNVAFVRFATQDEAHTFARTARKSDKSLRMLRTYIEVVPEDIIWANIDMNPYQRKISSIVSWGLTSVLIIFWAIPTAFVGFVSNVNELASFAPFSWILQIPDVPLGIIKAVLPPAALAVLFMLLPIVLRAWIKLQGEIRKSDVELKLFTRYWLFWVIHGFLIVTLSSGLIGAFKDIKGTASQMPTLLSENLPKASIFFLTFILTATWSTAAQTLSRIVPWVMWQLRGILAGGTPRKAYAQKYKLDSFLWSTTMPNICLIVCITLVYSVIQPLITVIALVGTTMFYCAFKYQLLWTSDQPAEMETGGLYYRKMLRTVFVALYLEEICLAGLFFLSAPKSTQPAMGYAFGGVMVAMGIITIGLQVYIDWFRYKPETIKYGWMAFHSSSQTHLNPHEKFNEKTNSPVPEELEAGRVDHEVVNEFNHPAVYKKQPVIWIAQDPLGLGPYEADQINAAGVEASTEFAHMDAKGNVDVERGPPDEPFDGEPNVKVD